MQKELDITVQKYFNTNLYHAYPLCILLAKEKYLPWFYENYVQLWGIVWNHNWVDNGLTDSFWTGYTGGIYNQLLDITALDYAVTKYIPNIILFAKEKLLNNQYLVIFVDEYYITTSAAYNSNHFTHEYLLYGFNTDTNSFLTIGFDKNRIFTKLSIDMGEFKKAFENAKTLYKNRTDVSWLGGQSIVILKDKEFSGEYPFDLKVFNTNLNNYLNSSVKRSDEYFYNFWNLDICEVHYGIDTYNIVTKLLEFSTFDGIEIDYKQVHLLYENKCAILTRLKYVSDKYDAHNLLENLISRYEIVVNNINIVRMKVIKITTQNLKNVDKIKYDIAIKDLCERLCESMDSEKSILTKAISNLEKISNKKNLG